MMETQKLILYVALGLVLMMLWQSWTDYNRPPAPVGTGVSQSMPGDPASPSAPVVVNDGTVPDAPQAPAATQTAPANAPVLVEEPEQGKRINVVTDLLNVDISVIGADIRKAQLLKYPIEVDEPERPLSLMMDTLPDLYYTETGLLGHDHEFPSHKTEYSVSRDQYVLADGQDMLSVTFSWNAPSGLVYRKIYEFKRDSYVVDIRYEVENTSSRAWNGFQYAQFVRTQVADDSSLGFLGRLPSYKGGAIYTSEEKFEKYDFADMTDEDLKRVSGDGWASMLQHYFVGAWLPQTSGPREFYSSVANVNVAPVYRFGYKTLTPVTIEAGAKGEIHNQLFIGPKEQDRLDAAAEGLVLSVDYGWLTAVSAPLFWLLNWIFKLLGNWGWAIIFLTLLIKLVFFPLSAASYKSMAKMKNLQPRMKTLKDRYGDDRQKFQQEMMKIYKEEKINPLGGCLPILVQIPVFIALYWVLLESVELRQASWFWLQDLSVQDPYYILPILMGVSMVVQQKLNPAPMDDMQKKIMMALPFVFTIFFLFFPSGLVLYWVVNNILSIAQQWVITKNITSS